MRQTQKIGALGEELVEKFLVKRGHTILDRNYRRPWGELDIVSVFKGKIHFVEVKALSRSIVSDETLVTKPRRLGLLRGKQEVNVSDETSEREKALAYIRSKVKKDRFRAEDRVNKEKIKRQGRIIQTYLNAKNVSDETTWQFDVATVLIDEERKKAKIELLEDLVF
jgi:putative endonuclease